MAAGQLAIVGAIFVVGWIAVATVQNVPLQNPNQLSYDTVKTRSSASQLANAS
jgi:hypothetical protein